ncbi:hypothetical protein M501DRAFT_997783 [Patellaria atrata CBS 101060]|uniref:IgE-binding protein n=1 Tax=Patellaria atrata CBS 101060 TaxID=1346257 RepID=A0A9P4S4V7_9PEZI|nr:hypothetical protein M501DRAFT_997783 [Patellaria atrata CBS 101060]
MKSTIIASSLFSLLPAIMALPAPALAQEAEVSNNFVGISARSASPIHLLPVVTHNSAFWLGGETYSYCPTQVEPNCPPGNTTVFAGGDEYLGLGVLVPGGQSVYIAQDGSMTHTTAHSAYYPPGAVRDGWTRTEGENFGHLSHEAGLVACPVEGGYKIFAQIPTFVAPNEDCLGFSFLTGNVTEQVGAWQY